MDERANIALKDNDFETLGKIVDTLRFRAGMNYDNIYSWFVRNVDEEMSRHQFEELMQRLDERSEEEE